MKTGRFGGFQGDVDIVKLESLPVDAKLTEQRTVAYGETTGHYHIVTGECEAYEVAEGLVFVVAEDQQAQLVHQEHDSVTLTTGIWFCPIVSQVEYDGKDERRIID